MSQYRPWYSDEHGNLVSSFEGNGFEPDEWADAVALDPCAYCDGFGWSNPDPPKLFDAPVECPCGGTGVARQPYPARVDSRADPFERPYVVEVNFGWDFPRRRSA